MKRALVIGLVLALSHTHGEVAQLPGLRVQSEEKLVEATGQISTTNGILEFVAVEAGGRDYESLLTLTCRPSALKFALLLLGLPTGATNGAPLRLDIEWAAAGKSHRVPVETLLLDRTTGKSPATLPFIFSGSFFGPDLTGSNQIFYADIEQAHVALWWQPSVLINVRGDCGNPYRGDNQGFEVNSKLVPPAGTPVKLIFRPRE
ncbi:MAG: YdjY domain-containing protein [Verrucomicrobiota bacterium]